MQEHFHIITIKFLVFLALEVSFSEFSQLNCKNLLEIACFNLMNGPNYL